LTHRDVTNVHAPRQDPYPSAGVQDPDEVQIKDNGGRKATKVGFLLLGAAARWAFG